MKNWKEWNNIVQIHVSETDNLEDCLEYIFALNFTFIWKYVDMIFFWSQFPTETSKILERLETITHFEILYKVL